MKRLKTILLFLVICISCFGQNRTRTNTSTTTNTNQKVVIWEYKVVKEENWRDTRNTSDEPKFSDFIESKLNRMGSEGWELVNVYTEIATAFPNFGNGEYHTGIKSNTRTNVVNFVFKRPKSEK